MGPSSQLVCAMGSGDPSDSLVTYALKGLRALVVSCMGQGAYRPQESACDICAERPVDLQCMCQGAYGPEWLVYTAMLRHTICTKLPLGGHLALDTPKFSVVSFLWHSRKAPSYLKPWGTTTTAQVHTPALAMADTHNKTQYHSVHTCVIIHRDSV